ncbi:hypothetical protein GC207_03190 [bacterium]|nr:hypothetical protein [bacterium]
MKSRKWPVILFAFGALAIGVLLIFASTPIPPRPSMPSLNGYQDFLTAAAMLAPNTSRYDELTEDELRALVATNQPALDLVRSGLARECRVPLGLSVNAINVHLPQLASIKSVAQALRADGHLAELEDRPTDAARSYLDAIRLGEKSMRGGLLIDGLVGIACEAIGSAGMKTIFTNLDAKACRENIGRLQMIEEDQVPFAEIRQNEKAWVARSYPFYQRAVTRVAELFHPASSRLAEQKALQKFQAQEKRLRALMIELAARAYELEKGTPATNVAELVPEYLKAIPKDPVTGADMVVEP